MLQGSPVSCQPFKGEDSKGHVRRCHSHSCPNKDKNSNRSPMLTRPSSSRSAAQVGEHARTVVAGGKRIVVAGLRHGASLHHIGSLTTHGDAAEVALSVVHVGVHVVVACRGIGAAEHFQLVADAVDVGVVHAVAVAVEVGLRVDARAVFHRGAFLVVAGRRVGASCAAEVVA